jgi:hypothetical protein
MPRLGGHRSTRSCFSKRTPETTPIGGSDPASDTVDIIDPAHPLYGLTLPLRRITTNPHLGRVCVVELYPGVVRFLPLAVTDRAGVVPPPSPCRLSLAALHTLQCVVASLPSLLVEDIHAPDEIAAAEHAPVLPTFAIRSFPARTHAVKLLCDTRDADRPIPGKQRHALHSNRAGCWFPRFRSLLVDALVRSRRIEIPDVRVEDCRRRIVSNRSSDEWRKVRKDLPHATENVGNVGLRCL